MSEYPSATISQGETELLVYLPDSARGFYRGPRFDWSGMIGLARFRGHELFGRWKPSPHDPSGNDDASGPAGEFGMGPRTGNPPPLGYAEAAPGETFLKIGVGRLVKRQEAPYGFGEPYELRDPVPWRVEAETDRIVFAQEADLRGFGYRYSKEVAAEEDGFTVRYCLENTGSRPIVQSFYSHNFIRIDCAPVGRGWRLRFPFSPRLAQNVGDAVAVYGNALEFVRDLGPQEGMFAVVEGFRAEPYEVAVECGPAGAGVSIRGSVPMTRFSLFSTGCVVCPEPLVAVELAPGGRGIWSDRYTFHAGSPT